MIALLAAAAVANASPNVAASPPAAVLAKYRTALATLKEPRVFAVEYTLEQTGVRTLEQTHRIFRNGRDERDETIAVNGTRSSKPVVRIFRGRPYRYAVRALAPSPAAYAFAYEGTHRDGKHLDYVFRLAPKAPSRAFAFSQVVIDGITFLPVTVRFVTGDHDGKGSVSFFKSGPWWVASGAAATARASSGIAREQLAFHSWRFPPSLPPSTFAVARSLPTPPPAALAP